MERFDLYLGFASIAFAFLFVVLAFLVIQRGPGEPAASASWLPRDFLIAGNPRGFMLLMQAAGFAALGASRLIDYTWEGLNRSGVLLGLGGTLSLLIAPLPIRRLIVRRQSSHA